MRLLSVLTFLALLAPSVAGAHGGGLDDNGCHNSSRTGQYHCHKGPMAGHSFDSERAMREQLDGVSGGATSSGAPSPSGYQEYDRDLYAHWSDADGDCIDARHEVLAAESRVEVTYTRDGCAVTSGLWICPFTGKRITDPSELHVDHMVPLAEAHRSGAYNWSYAKRKAYANDLSSPRTLVAVDAGANMSKSASDPAEWLPDRNPCGYVRDWVSIKQRWGLSFDPRERRAIDQVLSNCANRGR